MFVRVHMFMCMRVCVYGDQRQTSDVIHFWYSPHSNFFFFETNSLTGCAKWLAGHRDLPLKELIVHDFLFKILRAYFISTIF